MESSTWILLRGLGREKGHWGPFMEQFKKTVPGDEILAIDLPGMGEHRELTSPQTIEGIFNFVRAEAVAKARRQGQFKILATSLGGMVALEWMRQKSDDLAKVALINTSVHSLSPFYYRLRWQVWKDILRLATVQGVREREKGIIELLMNSAEARDAALSVWTKIAMDHPVSYISFFNQILAASRFSLSLKDCPVPVLLLNGLGDRLVDPSCSTSLHEKWGWPIVRHPWGGHDLVWDDAPWVINKVAEWNRLPNA